MEERRGESIESTLQRAGPISKSAAIVLQADARVAAARQCDEHGIDPNIELGERVTRYIDIMHGSPHMEDEKVRMQEYKTKG